MYTFHGVVPCVAVTVPLTGSVTDVTTYDCMGCGSEVTETLPVIGNVMDVEMYVCHGVVACVTPIGTFVTLTGKIALVET